MAEQKTKPTEQSVESFLDKVPDEKVRDDCFALIKLMKKVTGSAPKMWGPSIVGFGKYHNIITNMKVVTKAILA